jgi:hypothetical protein
MPSYGSASGSSSGSPSIPYRYAISHQHFPEAPSDNNSSNILHHPSENHFHMQNSQNMYNSLPSQSDFISELDQQSNIKLNGYSGTQYRPSFSAFPSSRPRINPPSISTYRDNNSSFFPQSNDTYPPRITSPITNLPFESRSAFEHNASQSSAKQQPFALSDYPPGILPAHSSAKTTQSHNPAAFAHSGFSSGMQMSSQTPYGPHIPASNNAITGPMVTSVPMHAATNPAPQEEISTIFVVGFPEDMQEREFQNMFTFSPGFEAATLKIPNKEFTAYGGSSGARQATGTQQGFSQGHVTTADAFTVTNSNDANRDSAWGIDDQFANGANGTASLHQRKQIIGFAKFRTREQALAARDVLQGKRVDIEKGAVLKAEMAKKNLHTKRGVPPAIPVVGIPNMMHNGVGVITTDTLSQFNAQPVGSFDNNLTPKDRESNSLSGWPSRDHVLVDAIREEEDRDKDRDKRQREAGALNAMGLGAAQRGARARAEEMDRERRKEKERQRSAAFDAFHSVPVQASNELSAFGALDSDNSPQSSLDHSPHAQGLPPTSTSPGPNMQSGLFSPTISHQSSSSILRSQRSSGPSDSELTAAIGSLIVSTSSGTTSPQLSSPESGASPGGPNKNSIDQNPPINTLYVGNLPTMPPPSGFPQDHLEDSLRELFNKQAGFRRLCFRMKNNGPMCFVEFEDVAFATRALNDLYGNSLNGLVKGGGIRLSYSKNPLGVRTPTSAGSACSVLQQQQSHGEGASQTTPVPLDAFQLRPLQQDVNLTTQRRDTMSISSPPPSFTNFMTSPPPRFASSPPNGLFTNGHLSLNGGSSNSFLSRCSLPYNGGGLHGGAFAPFGVATSPLSPPLIPDHPRNHDHLFALRDSQQTNSQHHLSLEVSRAS